MTDSAGFEQVPPRYFWRRVFAFVGDFLLAGLASALLIWPVVLLTHGQVRMNEAPIVGVNLAGLNGAITDAESAIAVAVVAYYALPIVFWRGAMPWDRLCGTTVMRN
ncbi:MAG: hypothetical protein KGH84_00580 [Paracoccaceae bacterium]|nr:hypothetical protein [Paracoccaceae bacterium]